MDSRIAMELKLRFKPVAVIFANEKPEGATQFKEGRWGCVVAMHNAAATGKTVVFDRKTYGCGGGGTGLGFGNRFVDIAGGIENMLAQGLGEGYPEGERRRKTPEVARMYVEELPIVDIPYSYVIFKPLAAVDPATETPQVVNFYANPDQISALVTLANYDRAGSESVILRAGAGCTTICLVSYREARSEQPRAVVGLTDISVRPKLDPDILSFSMPYDLFLRMEANVPGSFLETPAWRKVRDRIPDPPLD